MPLYDYECPHCSHKFEEFRSIAERHTAPCPSCTKDADKVLSSFFTSSNSAPSGPGDCGPSGCPPMGGG